MVGKVVKVECVKKVCRGHAQKGKWRKWKTGWLGKVEKACRGHAQKIDFEEFALGKTHRDNITSQCTDLYGLNLGLPISGVFV